MSYLILIAAALIPSPGYASTELNVLLESSLQGVPTSLALAIADSESGFDRAAKGATTSKGTCRGVFQILESTGWKECGLTPMQLHDENPNIWCGVRYLKSKLSKYKNLDLVIASFNSGSPVTCRTKAQINKYGCKKGDIINRSYVNKVKSNMRKWE